MWTYNNDEYLAHHGILGMKWGVRRYQNEDGTLTAEGKKRARAKSGNPVSTPAKKVSDMSDEELIRDNRRHALEAQYVKNHPKKKSKLQRTKESVDSGKQLTGQIKNLNQIVRNSRKKAYSKDLSDMTDDDLRKVINRKNLEQQYRNIVYEPDKIDRGQAVVDEILDYGGAALAITSSALSIALAMRELKKT